MRTSFPIAVEGRLTSWSSAAGYALVSLGLVVGGLWVADRLGIGGPAVVAGALGAWAVQVASFRALVSALAAERSALRPWLAGVAARFGGLVVAAVATLGTEAGVELPLAYAATLLALLLGEAGWLARRPWPSSTRTDGIHEDTQAG